MASVIVSELLQEVAFVPMNHYNPVLSKDGILAEEEGSCTATSSQHKNNFAKNNDTVVVTKSPPSKQTPSSDDCTESSYRVHHVFPVSMWTYLYASW